MRRIALLLAVCLDASAQAVERFSLTLPDLFAGQLDLGGTVRVGRHPVREIVVTLHGRKLDAHEYEISLNGEAVEVSDFSNEAEVQFRISARSDLLAKSGATRLAVGVRDSKDPVWSWNIIRHDFHWILESRSGPKGESIRIELTRPTQALLQGTREVEFAGSVSAFRDRITSVRINDQTLNLAQGSDKFPFAAKLRFATDSKGATIVAQGSQGTVARLHYPLISE